MPGKFINSGTNPFGKLSLVNNSNSGNLNMSLPVGFTIFSSDFTIFSAGFGCEADNTSFNIGGTHPSGEAFYGPIFDNTQGGNIAKADEIAAYFAANGLTVNSNSYLFNVTYGPGSSVTSGIAVVSFVYYNNTNVYLNMGTVNTTIPGWDTPGTNPFSLTAQEGTFNLPMTFSVYSPTTQDISSWC